MRIYVHTYLRGADSHRNRHPIAGFSTSSVHTTQSKSTHNHTVRLDCSQADTSAVRNWNYLDHRWPNVHEHQRPQDAHLRDRCDSPHRIKQTDTPLILMIAHHRIRNFYSYDQMSSSANEVIAASSSDKARIF